MSFSLSVEKRFLDEVWSLPRDAQKKVVRAVVALQRDPHQESAPLEGAPGIWRRKVPPYRILFMIGEGWIHVYSVQHRQGVYKRIRQPTRLPAGPAPQVPELPQLKEVEEPSLGSYDWSAAERVLNARTPEDLLELVDFGLPDNLFDRLVDEMESQGAKGAIQLRLVKKNVVDAFFGRLLATVGTPPLELIIVAPWLTAWDGPRSSFGGFRRYLRAAKTRTVILTRAPDLPAHKRALEQLSGFPGLSMYIVPDLHAKFFVCDVAPSPYGLIASANTTARSFVNLEVGVFIQGSGQAEALIRDLQGLSVELRAIGKEALL